MVGKLPGDLITDGMKNKNACAAELLMHQLVVALHAALSWPQILAEAFNRTVSRVTHSDCHGAILCWAISCCV